MIDHHNTGDAESKQGLSQYDETLIEEFCCLVAVIAVRLLTKDVTERDNQGPQIRNREAKQL